jgi:hypothetical protein
MSRWAFSITLAASAAFYGLGLEGACAGDAAIKLRQPLGNLRVLAGDHFDDPIDGMLPIARVYPFGGIAEKEVLAPLQSGNLLDQRAANVFRHPGINRAFVDYDRPSGSIKKPGKRFGRPDDGSEIGLIIPIHGRRHRYNIYVRAGATRNRVAELQAGGDKCGRVDLVGPVMAGSQLCDPFAVDVEARDVEAFCQRHGQR